MNAETRSCQNCRQDFRIEPEDFEFYEKIKVPPPTWCPECRMVRRFLWRNERSWYRRTCDATGAPILSMIAPDKPHKVYEKNHWQSDQWDPLSFGRPYDFTKSFFQQFRELFEAIPHPNLIQKNCINSEYSNYSIDFKNVYFSASGVADEDSGYLFGRVLHAKDCYDVHQSQNIEQCYELIDSIKSSRVYFGQNCEGCVDGFLLYDCRNCMNCFGCVGLRNKQYYIFNQPYSKEQYIEELKRLDRGGYQELLRAKQRFEELKIRTPRKYAMITRSENVLGDDITDTRNCQQCFFARRNVENCKYSFVVFDNSKDGMDAFIAWNGAELFYDVMSVEAHTTLFSALIWGGFGIQYSYNCYDCNNLFGCVGLRNKSYCILNQPYSKEEYESLLPRIIQHMNTKPYVDAMGRQYTYGEFFPPELSPFAYNETVAQDYYPVTKERAME